MATQTTDRPAVADNSIDVKPGEAERLKQIRERFSVLKGAWSNIFEKGRDDDRFVAGYQWPEEIKNEREDDGRPVLTYNLLERYVSHITNQVRANWPQARILPVEGDKQGSNKRFSNVAGTKDYSQAEVLQGIIRNIEHISRADQAYDTAVEHSTRHGFGFFRIITQYSHDDSFDQDILIKRVKNSYNCLIDLAGEDADYSDANDAFVFSTIQEDVFKNKYPGVAYTQLDAHTANGFYDGWYDSKSLRVAEYYFIEYEKDEVLLLSDGSMEYLSEIKTILDELEEEQGITIIKRRDVKRRQCKWQKMTADTILEGPIDIPTSYIPLLLVAGKEYIIDGQYELHSAVRQAKDAQKSYNFNRTAATEAMSLEPKAPYIGTEEQFAAHPEWDDANKKNLPYLPYTHVDGIEKPSRTFPTGRGQAELMNAQMDKADIREIIGLPEASMGDQSNEISGKAIKAKQAAGNVSTFIFPDNLNRAIEQAARILIEMIPRVYTSGKMQRIQLPGDQEDFVEINKMVKNDDSGEDVIFNDIGLGKFDVRIDTGPSYETRRQESTDAMLQLMQSLPPQKADAIAHLVVKNMDFPGADAIYDIMRKMLPDQFKTEEEKAADLPEGFIMGPDGQPVNEETGEPLPPTPPTPEQELQGKQLEADNKEAEAKIATAAANTAKAAATQAEAEKDMAALNAGGGDRDQAPAVDEGAIMDGLIGRFEEMLAAHTEDMDEKIVEASLDVLKRVKLAQSNQPAAEVA